MMPHRRGSKWPSEFLQACCRTGFLVVPGLWKGGGMDGGRPRQLAYHWGLGTYHVVGHLEYVPVSLAPASPGRECLLPSMRQSEPGDQRLASGAIYHTLHHPFPKQSFLPPLPPVAPSPTNSEQADSGSPILVKLRTSLLCHMRTRTCTREHIRHSPRLAVYKTRADRPFNDTASRKTS